MKNANKKTSTKTSTKTDRKALAAARKAETKATVAKLVKAGWTHAAVGAALELAGGAKNQTKWVGEWSRGEIGASDAYLGQMAALVDVDPPREVVTGSITIRTHDQAAKIAKVLRCRIADLEAAGQLRFTF